VEHAAGQYPSIVAPEGRAHAALLFLAAARRASHRNEQPKRKQHQEERRSAVDDLENAGYGRTAHCADKQRRPQQRTRLHLSIGPLARHDTVPEERHPRPRSAIQPATGSAISSDVVEASSIIPNTPASATPMIAAAQHQASK